jgi:hypothetical protein
MQFPQVAAADVKIVSTSDLELHAGNTKRVTVASAGGVTVASGDVRLTTGGLFFDGTLWGDIPVPLASAIQTATAKPDFDYTNVGFLFPNNDATETLSFIVNLPPSYKEGASLYPYVQWLQAADQAAVFKIDYKWFNRNAAPPANFTTLALSTYVYTYDEGTLHQVSRASAAISGTGKEIASVLLVKLYRDDAVYTGDATALHFGFHHQIDSIGSEAEYTKSA